LASQSQRGDVVIVRAVLGLAVIALSIGVGTIAVLGATLGNDADIAEVVGDVRKALEQPAVSSDELRSLAERLMHAAPQNQLVQQHLAESNSATAESLRGKLKQAVDVLSFRPQEEAPLPVGFPPLTPVGEIRLNEYPAYRLARTPVQADDGAAFWRLFRHIQSREIAMTSPVEMTYRDGDSKPQEVEMAFLYRSLEQGELERDGEVEVVDMPAQRVLSIGWRGDINEENVAAARRLLDAWLETHASEYRVAGRMRVMGHNSPFVPLEKRYFEVQLPIVSTQPEAARR
jgi:hypothetical protein